MTTSQITPTTEVTEALIWEKLKTVIDPELHIDIVNIGLVYEVSVQLVQKAEGPQPQVHIVMTVTTPGCPLLHVFEKLIKDALYTIPGFDPYKQATIDITFDPPWIPDMMSEEAKAELGF